MMYRGSTAIAVARVSTKRQAQGDGFRRQFDGINEWCELQGIIVVDRVSLASSAALPIARMIVEWKPVSDACLAHQPHWIVFHELDRALRSLDASVWLFCLNDGKTGTLIAQPPSGGMPHALFLPNRFQEDD